MDVEEYLSISVRAGLAVFQILLVILKLNDYIYCDWWLVFIPSMVLIVLIVIDIWRMLRGTL